jgi:hypothetical protein
MLIIDKDLLRKACYMACEGVLSMKCCFRHEMLINTCNQENNCCFRHEMLVQLKIEDLISHAQRLTNSGTMVALFARNNYPSPNAEYHAMPKRRCNERN